MLRSYSEEDLRGGSGRSEKTRHSVVRRSNAKHHRASKTSVGIYVKDTKLSNRYRAISNFVPATHFYVNNADGRAAPSAGVSAMLEEESSRSSLVFVKNKSNNVDQGTENLIIIGSSKTKGTGVYPSTKDGMIRKGVNDEESGGGQKVRRDGEIQDSDDEEEPPDPKVKSILFKDLKLTESECANNGEVCSRGPAMKLVASYAAKVDPSIDINDVLSDSKHKRMEKGGTPDHSQLSGNKPDEPTDLEKYTVEVTKKSLGCNTESCIFSKKEFIEFSKKMGFDRRTLKIMQDIMFKPEGPRNDTDWLSNIHIDSALQKWAVEFPFFHPLPFAMIDFATVGHPLEDEKLGDILDGKIPVDLGPPLGLVKRPAACIGCIVNTDVSSGPGKHWVSTFIDCRDTDEWSIEYFNSTGNNPPRQIVRWMKAKRKELEEYAKSKMLKAVVAEVIVTTVDHQKSDTECGVYSLFYIRRRLEGKSYKMFMNEAHKVVDQYMRDFRKFIFRDEKAIQ